MINISDVSFENIPYSYTVRKKGFLNVFFLVEMGLILETFAALR